jgi:hypothetical protein
MKKSKKNCHFFLENSHIYLRKVLFLNFMEIHIQKVKKIGQNRLIEFKSLAVAFLL